MTSAEKVDRLDIDRPMVIFPVGILGAAPLKMPSVLADHYDASYLSSGQTKRDIYNARIASGWHPDKARAIDRHQIENNIRSIAVPDLESEEDVVLDMLFNTVKSRHFPVQIARAAGATTLALCFETDHRIAEKRVRHYLVNRFHPLPMADIDAGPIASALKPINLTPLSAAEEGIDYVFNLNGDCGTDSIIAQFARNLVDSGLDTRYEDTQGDSADAETEMSVPELYLAD